MSDQQFPIAICEDCKDEITSRYTGEWRSCECFRESRGETGIYVDCTSYYIRIGGKSKYSFKPNSEEMSLNPLDYKDEDEE